MIIYYCRFLNLIIFFCLSPIFFVAYNLFRSFLFSIVDSIGERERRTRRLAQIVTGQSDHVVVNVVNFVKQRQECVGGGDGGGGERQESLQARILALVSDKVH